MAGKVLFDIGWLVASRSKLRIWPVTQALQKGFWVKVANFKLSSSKAVTDDVELGLPLELADILLLYILVALYMV